MSNFSARIQLSFHLAGLPAGARGRAFVPSLSCSPPLQSAVALPAEEAGFTH